LTGSWVDLGWILVDLGGSWWILGGSWVDLGWILVDLGGSWVDHVAPVQQEEDFMVKLGCGKILRSKI
jgi:hypothetical protein